MIISIIQKRDKPPKLQAVLLYPCSGLKTVILNMPRRKEKSIGLYVMYLKQYMKVVMHYLKVYCVIWTYIQSG